MQRLSPANWQQYSNRFALVWGSQASLSLSIHQLDWTSEFCQTAAPSETGDNPLDYWHCEEILVRFHNNPQQQFNHRLPLTHAVQRERLHFSTMQQNLIWSYTHAHDSPGVQQQHRCSSFFHCLSLTLSWVVLSQLCRCMLSTSGSRRQRVMERKRSERKWKEREKQTGRESRGESEERTLMTG